MTVRRDTTGSAARLVLRADRDSLSADGEDVAMFSVEVQDARGRTVPVTDNLVTFRLTGPAKVIGVGNGDPADQSPDKASVRKAFSGYCMAIVQTEKAGGAITIEATSPGLTSSSATVTSKQIDLRPQVAVWERYIPQGEGITGLWKAETGSGMEAMFLGSPRLFTLIQKGSELTGTVGGTGGFFGGGDVAVPITEGSVRGNQVSFKSGRNTFEGQIKGEQLQLNRTVKIPFHIPAPPKEDPGRPAIGPAPDGSDPSIDFGGRLGGSIAMVLVKTSH